MMKKKLQKMIERGELFSDKKIDLNDPDTEQRVLDLAFQMDECNCGNSEPHMHLAVEMPEGTNVSEGELQERVQKLFNKPVAR